MSTSLEYIMGGVEIGKTLAYLDEHPEDSGSGRLEEWKRLYAMGSPIAISGLRGLIAPSRRCRRCATAIPWPEGCAPHRHHQAHGAPGPRGAL